MREDIIKRFQWMMLFVLHLILAPLSFCQTKIGEGIYLDAEFRPRLELDHRDFNVGTGFDAYATFRTRVGIELRNFIQNTTLYLKIADSRLMGFSDPYLTGEPIGPNQWDNNLGISMAYLEVRNFPAKNVLVRIGRMSNNQGRNRIFGPGNWNIYGPRTYDGLKLGLKTSWMISHFWTFWGMAGDRHWYFNPETPGRYPDLQNPYKSDHLLIGSDASFWGKRVNLLIFLDLDQKPVTINPSGRQEHAFHRVTTGVNISKVELADGTLRIDGDVAFQTGRIAEPEGVRTISAYLIACDIRYQFGISRNSWIGLGMDVTSGDRNPDDGKVTQFYEYYYSKHSFQGKMDYFKSMSGIKRFGLQDFIFRFGKKFGKKVQMNLDAHSFRTAKPFLSRSSGKPARKLGSEIDLEFRYSIRPGLDWLMGFYLFAPTQDWQRENAGMATFSFFSLRAHI